MAKKWEDQLAGLAASLQATLGESLVALLLYGSAAGDGAHGPTSDVNLLLIVRDASSAGLKPVAEAIAGWTKAGYAPPLVFDEAEWRGCADVFPMEIEDMREAHRVLLGSDPLAGVETTAPDLRHELEREVRSKLLHLRTAYAAAAPDGKALEQLLEQSSATVMSLLRAARRVAGRPVPREPAEQVREAAQVAGFDAAALHWVLARRAGKAPRLAAYDPRAAGYVDAVQRVATWVEEQ